MRTRYEVEGWGVGELWTDASAVLAHDFDFENASGVEARVAPRAASRAAASAASPMGGAKPPSGTVAPNCSQLVHGFATIQRQRLQSDALDPKELAERLCAFLAGDGVDFEEVPLELDPSTPFQHAVTRALRAIPRGEVVTYGELAAIAGYPGAQRAVGSICAGNRFMFFVPCHRVVAADGIGGYGSAGVSVKRRLLALDGVEL